MVYKQSDHNVSQSGGALSPLHTSTNFYNKSRGKQRNTAAAVGNQLKKDQIFYNTMGSKESKGKTFGSSMTAAMLSTGASMAGAK